MPVLDIIRQISILLVYVEKHISRNIIITKIFILLKINFNKPYKTNHAAISFLRNNELLLYLHSCFRKDICLHIYIHPAKIVAFTHVLTLIVFNR